MDGMYQSTKHPIQTNETYQQTPQVEQKNANDPFGSPKFSWFGLTTCDAAPANPPQVPTRSICPDQQAPLAHGQGVALEDPLRQKIRGAHVGPKELEAGGDPPEFALKDVSGEGCC